MTVQLDFLDASKMELKDRLKSARKAAGKTQIQVAEAVGMTQSNYSQLETGSALASTFLSSIANYLQVDSRWLEKGQGDQLPSNAVLKSTEFKSWQDGDKVPDGFVEVEFLNNTFVSAGNGYANEEQHEHKHLWFREETLIENDVQPNMARCVIVAGKSMWPELDDKQVISVDTSATRIFDGEIYALNVGDETKVKYVFRWNGEGQGGIKLVSRNEDKLRYPDEFYSPTQIESENIRIIGQFWWKSEVRRVRR
jgi:phage repressor protein C with HTH and peptisase S24 domain